MKTIVVYYSNKGSNRYLAHKISDSLSCDIEEIRPRLNVFLLFLMSINFGIRPLKHNIQAYDKLILCGPIWMGKLIPPIRSFLQKYGEGIPRLVFVSCCGSSDAKKDEKFGHGFVFKEVEKIMGDRCVHCRAFPIDLVLPDDKKENGDLIMKTRLSEATFTREIQERLENFMVQINVVS
jgi:flavodoxin